MHHDEAYELTRDDLAVLALCSTLDWSSIEPATFGTLFERSLDPDKRSKLGAHYTSEDDIRLIARSPRTERCQRSTKSTIDRLPIRLGDSTV